MTEIDGPDLRTAVTAGIGIETGEIVRSEDDPTMKRFDEVLGVFLQVCANCLCTKRSNIYSFLFVDRRQKKNEPPIRLLDDLFRKTKATPCIYWLPLTAEQVNFFKAHLQFLKNGNDRFVVCRSES